MLDGVILSTALTKGAGVDRLGKPHFFMVLLVWATPEPAILHCILAVGLLQTRWKVPVSQETVQAFPQSVSQSVS